MSKAVLFFADGTEECEALLVADLLRRARVEVIIASAMGRRALVSSHGIHLNADALAEDVDYSDVDMVILPGGIPGTPNLAENKTVTDTCVSFARAGKKVAAICAAPSVLASLGLLEGRNATAHAGFQDKLAGAIVHDEEVVVDGSITTSYGLGGAIPFALEPTRNGRTRIRNVLADKYIDLVGMNTSNGAQAQIWNFVSGGNQEWNLERVDPTVQQTRAKAEEAHDPEPTPSQRKHQNDLVRKLNNAGKGRAGRKA